VLFNFQKPVATLLPMMSWVPVRIQMVYSSLLAKTNSVNTKGF